LLSPRILLGGGRGGGAPGDAELVKLADARLALEGVLDGRSPGWWNPESAMALRSAKKVPDGLRDVSLMGS
jgi:hypothetical protein